MHDKIKVDFTKTGLDNVKELLVDAGYPRKDLEKVTVYTNKKVDDQGNTELYVGTADKELAERLTNESVDLSTVPTATTDTDGSVKATLVKVIKHNYRRVDPLSAKGIIKVTDSDENGNYVDMTQADNAQISAAIKTPPGGVAGSIDQATITAPSGQTGAQYGLNQYGYSYTEEAALTFVKNREDATIAVRLRADMTRGNQVILFPKLDVADTLVDPSAPMAAFETKSEQLDPKEGLANIFLSSKTSKTGGNAKPNEVFGISIDLADVGQADKLKAAYFSKAYSDVPARQELGKQLSFKAGEVVNQDAEFGSKLIANVDKLVKVETNADLNDNTTAVETNIGFYVVPLKAKSIIDQFYHRERETGYFREAKKLEESLGERDKDATLHFKFDDSEQETKMNVDTPEGRESLKTEFERMIGEAYLKQNPAFKLVYQDPENGGVVYDKDSVTFKLEAAEGYENYIEGAVYFVADFVIGKFHVNEDLDGFGEVLL